MKRRLTATLIIAAILSLLLCLPVSAASDNPMGNLSMSFPSGYKKLTTGNLSRNSTLVKQLGFTPSSLKKYMQDENIYIIAAGEDAAGEFHIKCTQSEFSQNIGTFSGLNEEALTKINQTLFGGNAEACTIGKSKTIYFRTKSKVQSADFNTYQYVTVENGNLYSFVYYGTSSDEIDTFMKSLKIKRKTTANASTVATIVLVSVVIIGCLVAMGLIVVTIVSDMKKVPVEDGSEKEYIKIKRRKK